MSVANPTNHSPSDRSERKLPQIRVTKRGTPFVRPSDIFKSQVGRIQIRRNKSINLPKAASKLSIDERTNVVKSDRDSSVAEAVHHSRHSKVSKSSKAPQENSSALPSNSTEAEST